MALVQLQFNLRLRLDFTEFHFKMAKQQKAIISLGLRLCLHINSIAPFALLKDKFNYSSAITIWVRQSLSFT